MSNLKDSLEEDQENCFIWSNDWPSGSSSESTDTCRTPEPKTRKILSSRPTKSKRRPSKNEENPPSGRCLGIFGLNKKTREKDLRQVFSRYGPLEDLQMVCDEQSGRNRGFAFIYFEDKNDAAMAKEKCNGIEINSNKIAVDYSAQLFSRLIDRLVLSQSPKPVLSAENGGGDTDSSKPTATETMVRRKNKSFKCDECDKSYSKEQYVRDHMRSVHQKSVLNYSCRVCGEAFAWRVTTLKHIKRSHPEKKSKDMIEMLF